MTIRWRQLTQPGVLAVPIAVAKQQCRIIDIAAVATQANVSFGTGNSQLLILSKLAGSVGNQYSASVVVSGNNTPLSVSLVDTVLTINVATSGGGAATSTVNQVIAALYSNVDIAAVFDATSGSGDGSGVLASAASTALSGGLNSGDEDGYLSLLIAAAVEVLEQLTGRAFISRNIRMFLDNWPEDGIIELPLSPVSAVTALNYFDYSTEVSTNGLTLFEQDYQDQDLAPRLVPVSEVVLPIVQDKLNAITIDFTAGYGDSPNEIPPRIKQCILFLVAHWYSCREPVVNGTAVLSNKIPYTFQTTLNSFRMVTV